MVHQNRELDREHNEPLLWFTTEASDALTSTARPNRVYYPTLTADEVFLMARRPARRRDESLESTEAQETNESTEATEAPQVSEESVVTVTDPEAVETDVESAPSGEGTAPSESDESSVDSTQEVEDSPAQDGDATPPRDATEGEPPAAGNPPSEPKEKTKEDLEADFYKSVEDGVAVADTDTGTIPEAALSTILATYRALSSTASKQATKNWLADEMRAALVGNKIHRARALAETNSAVQEASSRRKSVAGVTPSKSPTDTYIDAILTLDVAKHLVSKPSDDALEDNWLEQYNQRFADYSAADGQVAKYLAWLGSPEADRGDEPEVDQLVKNAAKVAAGKSVSSTRKASGKTRSSTGSSVRRNTGTHIEEFLAQADPNREYTVAEVANFSSQEYAPENPSPGAVSARLFPPNGKESTIKGFIQVEGAEPKKIRKVA